jgi:hypothetical protein
MEAEYVALSTSCRDLFPLIDVTREICTAFLIEMSGTAQMHIKIHEDKLELLHLENWNHIT